jgi:hypothetical protein
MPKRTIPNTQGTTPEIGMLVVTEDGIIGEVHLISEEIKNLITHIKLRKADGKFDIIDVRDTVVEAIEIVKLIIKNGIFKKIGQFFKKLFAKKEK